MKDCDESKFPRCGLEMSNFDHTIDDGMEDALRDGKSGGHAAWDFYGVVWFEDGKFYEKIMQYQNHVDTLEADNLKDLMELACSQYGYA